MLSHNNYPEVSQTLIIFTQIIVAYVPLIKR